MLTAFVSCALTADVLAVMLHVPHVCMNLAIVHLIGGACNLACSVQQPQS